MSGIARPHLRWPGFIYFADIALFICRDSRVILLRTNVIKLNESDLFLELPQVSNKELAR